MSENVKKNLTWFCTTFCDALMAFLAFMLPMYGVSADVITIIIGSIAGVATFIGILLGVKSVKDIQALQTLNTTLAKENSELRVAMMAMKKEQAANGRDENVSI